MATLAYVVLTFVAGLRAHSLALISEAGHNVSDALALLLSFVAVYFQSRPPTDAKTFGYQRAGVLAGFVNALTLIVIAASIAIEAVHRLSEPVHVQPRLMMIVAAAGVVDERRDCRVAVAREYRREYSEHVHSHAGRHAFDGCCDCWRRCDFVDRAILDRSGALPGDCGADYLVVALDCAGDAEYSA